jgi:Fe2+ transport system protein FeoA
VTPRKPEGDARKVVSIRMRAELLERIERERLAIEKAVGFRPTLQDMFERLLDLGLVANKEVRKQQ